MKEITRERLLQFVSYNPETGDFTRVSRPCNKVKVGDIPRCINSEGYIHFRIDGCLYRAHRLAWLAVTGYWPDGQIDHINGIRSDNGFCNLRLVTNGQNQQNRRHARKDNSRGKSIGVGFFSVNGKWRARIQIDKKSVFLGYFDTEEAASSAYMDAKANLHPFAPEVSP